ncbi:hypothetical protein [Kribbella italica]|uniref:Uncharacterized protein n=1 Tax=Kribbella italica TaxID=1540520 RepID=A0A7W9MWG5_9ACTN|nr:hypothetical protein [Kribbella italica]MBB5838784.1 hypothetical protein [Kribbella italica]
MTENQAAQPAEEPVAGSRKMPSGLALAGAGSVLAVLAFLGGTAVGHAWGDGAAGNEQTQFGGPGGGGMRQFPGNQQPGQGTQQQDPNQQQQPGQTRTS